MEYFVKYMTLGLIFCCCSDVFAIGGNLTDYVEESCYGADGFIDSLQPNCSADEVIYPHDVYTYAKKIETGCPWQPNYANRNETFCCRYVNETDDCGMRYYGVGLGLEHYLKFTGQNKGLLQVAWNTTVNVCNQSIYFERTLYMRMTYNCIKAYQTKSVCNSSFTGNPLFLWNDGYPNADGGCSLNSGCICSIKSSGGSTIQIDGLDLRFAKNDSTGFCAQRLFIIDGFSNSDIACDDVNLFERRILFISSSDSIQLRYDNTLSGAAGNFWIMVQATNRNQVLRINCSQLNSHAAYSCGDSFTILSPLTTTPTTVATTTNNVTQTSSTTKSATTSNTSQMFLSTSGTTFTFNTGTGSTTGTTSKISNISTSGTTSPGSNSMTTKSSSTILTTGNSNNLTTTKDSSTMLTSGNSVTTLIGSSIKLTTGNSNSLSTLTSTGSSVNNVSLSSTTTGTSFVTTSADSLSSAKDESSSKGPVIGAIVGAVAAAAVAGLIAYSIWRKKMKGSYQVEPDYDDLFENSNDGIIASRPPERIVN